MSGIHTTSGVPFARIGLEAAIRAAVDDVTDVYAGFTWPTVHPDWVALTTATSEINTDTISPRRGMDETIRLGISVGAFKASTAADVDLAAAAYARAFEILASIQAHIMAGDNTTLGGAVLWCMPGSVDADGEEYDSGFQVEIAAEFICSHKVRAA